MEITISLPEKVESALLKQAEDSGQDLKTIVEHIIEISVEPQFRLEYEQDFEKDMLAFAEGMENIPAHQGNYSRSEIYHNPFTI